MSSTTLAEVASQIQEYWSPLAMKQLRENLMLGALVNKDYEGEIKAQGDSVNVYQVNAPQGQILTVGTNADSFNSEAVSTSTVKISADKRAVAAYEFQDLVSLQSQISNNNPAVMEALNFALAKQINNYLYSIAQASTSSPDHDIASVTDFNASALAGYRLLAAKAKWRMEPGWYALLAPSYYSDVMNAATLTSSDYGASDAPVIGGNVALKRFGFNILEDNSGGVAGEGISQVSPTSATDDTALLFHPDFMHLVMQTTPQIKISDLHSQKKFGLVMSIDVVFGAKMGIDGSKKAIKVYNT